MSVIHTFHRLVNKTRSGILLFCIVIANSWIPLSCADEYQTNDIKSLSFSVDTLFFDTVFTQLGTATRSVKLYNNSNKTLFIDEIRLNPNSVFRFNIDGVSGPVVKGIEILPKDSIFVFLEATLNPNLSNGVLIYEEDLIFLSETQDKKLHLAIPGIDAEYYLPTDTFKTNGGILPYSILPCNTRWNSSKPIVVVGYLIVDSLCQLEIEAGTQVHFFNNGALWIYRGGHLKVNGELHNKVVFQGTRRGFVWDEVPGQWDRILINEGSTENIIRNAIIKNGFIGLQGDHLSVISGQSGVAGKITLENVEIKNMSGIGIFTRGLSMDAYNLLAHNCGQYVAALTLGGKYNFYHTTLANYWSRSTRSTPSLYLNNFFIGSSFSVAHSMEFNLWNSIVYGNIEKEFSYDTVPDAGFALKMNRCILRVSSSFSTSNSLVYAGVLRNIEPKFVNPSSQNFRLLFNSPAIDSGSLGPLTLYPGKLHFDLEAKNRNKNLPDLGCYEFE